ncbi:MAG: phosphodiester glycosidase family protein [Lachnospiraceae bacterium]|nr:phosphodiester glycosidase family protein [Lachnospiraceae bacterium]
MTDPIKKPRPLWQVIPGDLLLACLCLTLFCLVHHGYNWFGRVYRELFITPAATHSVLPRTVCPEEGWSAPGAAARSSYFSALQVDAPTPEEPEEEPVPDNRTEWQIRFADHFTDEVVTTENSYSSPDISITITEHIALEGEYHESHYYVADVYVSCIECFRSHLANNTFGLYETQNIMDMALASSALLAMTGDFYSYQYSGLMVRNGFLLRDSYTDSDICVLYKDGTMETLRKGDYSKDELIQRDDIWQLWNFGPALLDADGSIPTYYNTSDTVSFPNPRSSVGYYEPGHYCFIVVDGRMDNWSYGLELPDLSRIYYDLGCKAAYNLDGGGSAVMVFDGRTISRQSNGGDRELGDCLLIGEPSLYDERSFPQHGEVQ